MDRAEMKRFLIKSKQEPVNCALGVGDDKSLALLLLSPHRSAKSLQGDLQKQFPSVFNARFGTAVVDTEDDPTLVKFMLNKAVTSMARRLVKTLKGTGFRKVQILLEDGSPVEVATEEEANGAAPQAAQPDAAALTQALMELGRRIGAITDPAQKEALAKRAREANAHTNARNLVYAAASIESLRRALDAPQSSKSAAPVMEDASPPPPPPMPEPSARPGQAAVTDALAALVRRIAVIADPAQKADFANQARGVQAEIKAGHFAQASGGIDALQRALAAAERPVANSAPSADPRVAQYQAAFAKLLPALEKVVAIAPQRREAIDLQTETFKAAMAAIDFDQAKEALMEMGLLAKPPADAAAEIGPYIEILNSTFRTSRLAWGQTRQRVHGQIRQFQAALRDELRDEPDFAELDFKVALLDRVLQRLDNSLETKLDDAMNADKIEVKRQLKQESHQQVLDYIAFVNENPMIARLDGNDYMPMTVCADLTGQLADLAQSLA
jgi:hypothetical protein